MTGHTYLMKSRHGVYYMRVVEQQANTSLETKSRERRLSLRTKNRSEAKIRLRAKLCALLDGGTKMHSDDTDDEERLFWRGLTLIDQIGSIDPRDHFALSGLAETLSDKDLRAYIFAYEHIERDKARSKAREILLLQEELDLARQRGVARSPGPVASLVHEPKGTAGSSQDQPQHRTEINGSDSTVSDAVERFIKLKTSARPATAQRYRSQCLLFMKIVEDATQPGRRLSTLGAEDLRRYTDALVKLPRKVAPTDSRSIADLLISGGPTMAPKTRFAHARTVNMFLEWCVDQGYQVQVPFSGILKPHLKKPQEPETEKSFNLDELRTIFASKQYQSGLFPSASEYWIPLLALFTGARQGELCQLHHADVRQDPDTSIWVFDFNQKGEKQLKRPSSGRLVPIHSQLITLGFLKYCDTAKRLGGDRVFPDLERNHRGEFSAYSKRFNRFIADLGIKSQQDARKNFHSFRHSLTGLLIEQGTEEYVVNTIVGHSQTGRSESVRTYSKGVSLASKQATLEKVQWGVDFGLLTEPHMRADRCTGKGTPARPSND